MIMSVHTGGCDGCLNLDNPDNAGLGDLVQSLETLYQEQGYSDILSRSTKCCIKYLHITYLQRYLTSLYLLPLNSDNRADFWALAGITAVDKGIEISNEGCLADDCAVPESGLVFQWGRQVSDSNSK